MRHSSTLFTVITGHEDPDKDGELDWETVAKLGGTIVVLMGIGRLPKIVGRLLDGGLDADTPAMPLAEAVYHEVDRRVTFESEALRAYAERRIRGGQPLLFLIKLTDAQEDRPSTLLVIYSANVDGPRHAERRPRLTLEWDAPGQRLALEQGVHLEHGRSVDLPALVLDFERQLIDQALTRTEGNRGAAARLLGLKRTTLVEKLRRLSSGREAEVGLAAGE